jgi:hypothetical protein
MNHKYLNDISHSKILKQKPQQQWSHSMDFHFFCHGTSPIKKKYCMLSVLIIFNCKNFRFFRSVVGREFSFQFPGFLRKRSAEFFLKR